MMELTLMVFCCSSSPGLFLEMMFTSSPIIDFKFDCLGASRKRLRTPEVAPAAPAVPKKQRKDKVGSSLNVVIDKICLLEHPVN